VLVMTGANSAVGLRSMPVRYLFLDEVDGYPLDVEGEGDAISLAEARTRTFARRKIFIVSTPTISGRAAIEREYEASDQRRYFVPCRIARTGSGCASSSCAGTRAQPETAAYICESCDTAIAEHHKTWMLEHGEWRDDHDGKTAGFHLSSLYSPVGWRSGATSPLRGKPPSARNRDRPPPSRPSRTPNWVKPGSRKAKRRTGNGWSSAARIPRRHVPQGGLLLVGAPTCRRIASRRRSGPSGAARSPGWSSTAC
jgi:hypothetical protein